MSIAKIAAAATERLIAALVWRLAAAILIVIFVVAALYHFTIAGTFALELQVGVVYARLIVGGIYTLLALAMVGVLWMLARKSTPSEPAEATPSSRAMQLAALIEAAMLGYEASRKRKKTP